MRLQPGSNYGVKRCIRPADVLFVLSLVISASPMIGCDRVSSTATSHPDKQAPNEQAQRIRIQDVPNDEFPRRTVLTEDVEVQLTNNAGHALAQAGMTADVLGRRDEHLLLGLLGGRVIVHYSATTIVDDNQRHRDDMSRRAEETRQRREQDAAIREKGLARARADAQKRIDEEFMRQYLAAGHVTSISLDSTYHFHVTLPSYKYTTKENIRSIAQWLARAYVLQNVEKGGTNRIAMVHVHQGGRVVARGSYRQ